MKRIIFIGILFLASCKKEDDKQDSAAVCNCYEYVECNTPVSNGNGGITTKWLFYEESPKAPDLCAKETGQWLYYGNAGQFRKKVICD